MLILGEVYSNLLLFGMRSFYDPSWCFYCYLLYKSCYYFFYEL